MNTYGYAKRGSVIAGFGWMFVVSLLINLGMWFERFNIVVTSLSRDYLPSVWTSYAPTWVEVGTYVGTLGIFVSGILLFFRYIPMIAVAEVKTVRDIGKRKHD